MNKPSGLASKLRALLKAKETPMWGVIIVLVIVIIFQQIQISENFNFSASNCFINVVRIVINMLQFFVCSFRYAIVLGDSKSFVCLRCLHL